MATTNLRISAPFQVTEAHVYASSTLTYRDIGKWALMIQGCYHFFGSYSDALTCKQECERDDG